MSFKWFKDTLTIICYQQSTELLEHAIINWRDVPSIAKLMTMGFIQRSNETAEYLASSEKNAIGGYNRTYNVHALKKQRSF